MYRPQATKIYTGGTAKTSAGSGLSIYVVAVTNGNTGGQTLTFADDADLGVLNIGANGSISLPCPIKCSSFSSSHADLSIVYYEGHSQS